MGSEAGRDHMHIALRPKGVAITSALMAFSICVGIVWMIDKPIGTTYDHHHSVIMSKAMIISIRIWQMAFTAFQCFVVWSYWIGRKWTRQFVLVISVLDVGSFLLFQCLNIAGLRRHSHLDWFMQIFESAVAAFLIWYLNTREARAWFTT
jgi:hypothetical protein